MVRGVFSKIGPSLLSLLFPPRCLHCNESVEIADRFLCESCSELMELLNPAEHCKICFSNRELMASGICVPCHDRKPLIKRSASCFSYAGPAASIIKKFKYSNTPQLASGIAAFMGAQFMILEWPIPDLIIPVPISLSHWFDRGYNQSMLIAESLGKLLHVPVKEVLCRSSGDFSQAGLDVSQRQSLEADSFKVKGDPVSLQDKKLLLIDDVFTTGSTVACCASVLNSCFPDAIYSLTFGRAFLDYTESNSKFGF